MTNPRTKFPIESFGPELMAALLRGGRERVVIPFEGPNGKKLAHNFQRRIHQLRNRMRDLEHPDYILASRAKVSIFWGEKAQLADPRYESWKDDHNGHRGAIILIAPRDSEFKETLASVGINPTQPPVAVPTSSAYEHPKRDELDDLLNELSEHKP